MAGSQEAAMRGVGVFRIDFIVPTVLAGMVLILFILGYLPFRMTYTSPGRNFINDAQDVAAGPLALLQIPAIIVRKLGGYKPELADMHGARMREWAATSTALGIYSLLFIFAYRRRWASSAGGKLWAVSLVMIYMTIAAAVSLTIEPKRVSRREYGLYHIAEAQKRYYEANGKYADSIDKLQIEPYLMVKLEGDRHFSHFFNGEPG